MKLSLRMLGWVLSIPLLVSLQARAEEMDPGYASDGPWMLSARVGGEYSDNRDGLKKKVSNLDLYVEPRADYRFKGGDSAYLNLSVLPMVKWHSDPRSVSDGAPQHDTELFGTVAADAMYQLSRTLQFNFSDSLTYNDDPEITSGGTNVRRSDNHILNMAQAGLVSQISETLAAGLDGNYTLKRYDDSAVAQDEDEDIVSGNAYLKYKTAMNLDILTILSAADFKNDSTVHTRGAQVYGAALGLEKTFTPDVRGKVTAGYQHGEYDDSSLSSVDTPNATGELTLRAAKATRFRLGANYGLYTPYVRPYSLQTLTAFSAAVDHDVLANRLVATLSSQYGHGHYKSEGKDYPGGNDDFVTVGGSLSYKFSRNLSCDLGYSYENWDSDVRESFGRNLVDFAIKAQM